MFHKPFLRVEISRKDIPQRRYCLHFGIIYSGDLNYPEKKLI